MDGPKVATRSLQVIAGVLTIGAIVTGFLVEPTLFISAAGGVFLMILLELNYRRYLSTMRQIEETKKLLEDLRKIL
jgi:hypothetical protein